MSRYDSRPRRLCRPARLRVTRLDDSDLRGTRKTVLIVDDHPVVREGIRALLERAGEYAVIADAASHAEALRELDAAVPDMALVDLALRGSDALELTKTAGARFPRLPVLIVSMHDEALYAERALAAGAGGYVMKEVIWDTIVDAVRT